VSSATALVLLLLVGGLGSAALHPAGASVARAALAGRAGLAVGVFGAGGTVGVALGPLIVLAVVAGAGPAATPWLMIPGLLVGSAALLLMPPSSATATMGGRSKLLVNAGLPLKTVTAQELAPRAVASVQPMSAESRATPWAPTSHKGIVLAKVR
jgi:MFS family permease